MSNSLMNKCYNQKGHQFSMEYEFKYNLPRDKSFCYRPVPEKNLTTHVDDVSWAT